ncbi:MAG: restriction endonuclease subunit S [Alphaproteobacteria bacterium]|nr:restriction endonuclease subunit S [Alphaproteobacteria bacterium]
MINNAIYKDSGVSWIDEMPNRWRIQRLKNVLINRNESNNPIKTDFILSLTNDRGVIPYDEKGDVGNKSKDDLTGYKLAYPGDIVLNSMNVIIGSVGLSDYFGAVSPVYYMLYPRNKTDDVRFYNYIFQTHEFQQSLKGYGNGIMEIRMRIPIGNLNNVMLPIPVSEEQKAIADYLDRECARVDMIVEKQCKIIEKLKEYKKSVITEVVTKGLNPAAPMKDSRIEWIGKLPAHWNISKLKHYARYITDGTHVTPEYIAEGIPFLSIKDISSGKIDFSDVKYISESAHIELYKHAPIERGDILFTRIGTLGVSVIVDTGTVFDIFVSVGLVKPKADIDTKYLNYVMNSEYYYQYIQLVKAGGGTSAAKFNLCDVSNSPIIYPPMQEQQAIAAHLDQKCAEIDFMVVQREKMIDLFTEYKKALIYECVTGKKEVA